jgi:hypothetical protein
LAELSGNYRRTEIVALSLVAMMAEKKRELFGSFYALRYYPLFEDSTHTDDRLDNRWAVGIIANIAYEGLVYLQDIDRKPLTVPFRTDSSECSGYGVRQLNTLQLNRP